MGEGDGSKCFLGFAMLLQGFILGQLKDFRPHMFRLKTGETSYYIRKFTFKPNYGCQQKG